MCKNKISDLKKRIKLLEEKNKKLEKLAFFDPLTNTYNRTWFMKNITEKAKPYLVIVDLNNLKTINDSKGHPEGDKHILKVVKILQEFGKIVRYGGDEFIVLCKNKKSFNSLMELKTKDFSKGGATPNEYSSIGHAITLADAKLYLDKKNSHTNIENN